MLTASGAWSLVLVVSKMTRHFKPVLGAVGVLIASELVRRRFGMGASIILLAVLLLGWGLAYVWAERALNRLYVKFQSLDDDAKDQALDELDPEIRKDLEKRIAKAKNC